MLLPFVSHTRVGLQHGESCPMKVDEQDCNKPVNIAPVRSFEELGEAFHLVYHQYVRYGYMYPNASGLRFSLLDLLPTSVALVAANDENILGTATVIANSEAGLPCYELFATELEPLLGNNRFIGECTKFSSLASIKRARNSVSRLLIRGISTWCIYAGVDDLVIVVNPAHMSFWQKMVGFEPMSEVKACPYVRYHPGILMRLNVRSLVNGTWDIPRAVRRLIVDDLFDPSQLSNPYQLSDEEVTLLLLQDMTIFGGSSEIQKSALQSRFPHLNLDIRSEQESTKPTVPKREQKEKTNFQLRAHMVKLETLVNIRARKCGWGFSCQVDDDVPDGLSGDSTLASEIVTAIIAQTIRSAGQTSTVKLRISLNSRVGDEIELAFDLFCPFLSKLMIRGDGMLARVVPQEGTYWTQQSSPGNLRFCIKFRIFENSIHHYAKGQEHVNKTVAEEIKLPRLKVLVAEDNYISRKLVERILQKRGHEVHVVDNGQQVLDLYEKEDFDVILMDLQMPVRDGFSTTVEIRKRDQEKGVHTPIVALTAFVMRGDKERCLRTGIDAYVSKPIDVILLLQAIASAHEKKTKSDDQSANSFSVG